MTASILFAVALTLQAPAPPPKPVASTPVPNPRVKPPALAPADLADQHKAEMARTTQLRKIAALKKNAARSAKAQAEYKAAVAQQAYLDKMAPIWAAQAAAERDEMRRNMVAGAAMRSAAAQSSMANSMQKEAATDAARLNLQRAALYNP